MLHPKTAWSVLDGGWPGAVVFGVWVAVVADGFRYSVVRLSVRRALVCFLICLGLPVSLAVVFRTCVARPFKVPTAAMSPTLKGNRKDSSGSDRPGDHVWVNLLAYRSHGPQRGDIVVFRTKGLPPMVQPNTYYVKRVVGLPGEVIGIEPPDVIADGKRVTEPPVFRRISGKKGGYCGYVPASPCPSKQFCLSRPTDRVTLAPSEYFVLGDNSTNSLDSRYFGPVRRDAMIGKVVYIYAPAERKKWIK